MLYNLASTEIRLSLYKTDLNHRNTHDTRTAEQFGETGTVDVDVLNQFDVGDVRCVLPHITQRRQPAEPNAGN